MLIELGIAVTLVIAIAGSVWKLTLHLRSIEKSLTNDFHHALIRIEEKVDENSKDIANILGKLEK